MKLIGNDKKQCELFFKINTCWLHFVACYSHLNPGILLTFNNENMSCMYAVEFTAVPIFTAVSERTFEGKFGG